MGYLLIPASLVIGLPFIIISLLVRSHFNRKYEVKNNEEVIQITNTTWNIILTFFGVAILCGLLVGIGLFVIDIGLSIFKDNLIFSLILLVIGVILFISAIFTSIYFGVHEVGMIVIPSKGIFVIPSGCRMEELPLSDITKITRESGKKAFIHGTFGSRKVEYANKQKRDEGIATLERIEHRRFSSY